MHSPWVAGVAVATLALPCVSRAQTSYGDASRLFEGERWPEAAVAMNEVRQASNVTAVDRQHAQYRLGIALYRMGLLQAAYGLFAEIADKPNHPDFSETLVWLARLSTDLPEPADVVERVGKYDEQQVARFNNPQQRDIYWRLSYLLGLYAQRNARFDDALVDLARVGRSSPLFGYAQVYMGVINVQTRRSVPAVSSFHRLLGWLEEGPPSGVDKERLHDLGLISVARIYYSASSRLDENNTPIVDANELSAAVKYYRLVDPTGEFFLDSLFEEAWARFIAGDYVHALGNLRALSSPEVGPRYAEGALLEAAILYDLCRYDEVNASIANMKRAYEPQREELTHTLDALEHTADDAARLELVRNAHGVVARAVSDRRFKSYLAYDALLESERKLFDQQSAAFRSSKLADDVRDSLTLARELVERQTADLARARLLRTRDELVAHLRDAQKILIDTTAAQRNEGQGGTVPIAETAHVAMKPRVVSWPISGTVYPLDPQGVYRAPVKSLCGR